MVQRWAAQMVHWKVYAEVAYSARYSATLQADTTDGWSGTKRGCYLETDWAGCSERSPVGCWEGFGAVQMELPMVAWKAAWMVIS